MPAVRAASTFNLLVMEGQRVQSPLQDQPQTGHLKTLSRRPSSV
ncbi:hypothetical protein SynTAK9802_00772 [Synechococcus sp. TAK9802]|nr:hypothetical protein SynTAK9802_00772 [Synechococcus sp. TAK9802]